MSGGIGGAALRIHRRNTYFVPGALLWSLIVGVALGATLLLDERSIEDLALGEARIVHGALALIPTLLMTRQENEMGAAIDNFRGRVTSLEVKTSAHVPDEWERQALTRLVAGELEVSEIAGVRGQQSLRLICPILAGPICRHCHTGQNSGLGAMRGGISVAIPLAPLRQAHRPRVQLATLGLAFFWLIGLGAWVGVARTMEQRALESRETMRVFRDLFDGAPVAYHELDMNGIIVRVNRAECKLLGLSASEILGRPAWELTSREDREASRQAVRRKLSGAQPLSPVLRHYLRNDGSTILLEIHDTLVRNAAGETTGLRSLLLDVTVRAKAEADLRESEQSYRAQFAENMAVILLLDPIDGRIVEANKTAERFYGYTREQLAGMHISRINPMSESAIRETLEMVKEREGRQFHFQHRLADGSLRDVEVATSRIQFDGRTLVHEIIFDITARKKAEAELECSREQYALAVIGSNDGIWDWDIRRDTHYRSDRWLAMLGYSASEFPPTAAAFRESLHPEDKDRVLAEIDRYLRGEVPVYRVEFRIRHKSGSYLWVKGRGAALRDEHGVAYRMAGSHSDITERKQAEERDKLYLQALELARIEQERNAVELLEAKEAAEAANRAKSEFLANMSHEIRTPMNGVLGMAELALDTDLDPEQRDYISIVKTSGEALLAVINDILDFSKIEAGKLALHPVDYSLRNCLSDALRVVEPTARTKHLELRCDVHANVPDVVRGDDGRLRQVLLNLLSNSVKFTLQGEVLVTAKMNQGLLELAVLDTGIGIAAEKQVHVFDPFCQADTSTTRNYGGTGLGLSISRQLVSLMGGRIWLESEPGRGTTVRFTIRLERASSLRVPA